MFLYGEKILNDHNIRNLIYFLSSSNFIRGKDYSFVDKDKIILYETNAIRNSKFCYKYIIMNITSKHPYIGRVIDHNNRIVIDYVYDKNIKYSKDLCLPWTYNWDYSYNCSSVSSWIMDIISKIPLNKRNDMTYVATYFASKIDSINDPINSLIEGRWENTFSDGKCPNEWKNSGKYLEKDYQQNCLLNMGNVGYYQIYFTGIFRFLGL